MGINGESWLYSLVRVMDSYDLFGDDGSGMLEGLSDLGGSHSYAANTASTVSADSKEPSDSRLVNKF